MSSLLDWKFVQVFGDDCAVETIPDSDIISSIEFNQDGEFLAAGDRGGRVIIFQRSPIRKPPRRSKSGALHPNVEYRFFCEFQSHEAEFDYLRSVEIEERINSIKWLPKRSGALFLLSTNDKTMKLWKVYNKEVKRMVEPNFAPGQLPTPAAVRRLKVPHMEAGEHVTISQPRRVFANASNFRIHSIAPSASGDTFLAADDLRINMWWLEDHTQAYNVVDLKPAVMTDLCEVLTAANHHPSNSSMFAYATSKGVLRIGDLRSRALCDRHSKAFTAPPDLLQQHYYSDLLTGVSDLQFSQDGKLLVTRDYMNITIWDVAHTKRPLQVIPVHPQIKPMLPRLLDDVTIFDRFGLRISHDSKSIVTGSYSDRFHIYNTTGSGIGVEATRQIPRRVRRQRPRVPGYSIGAKPVLQQGRPVLENLPADLDTTRKVLHLGFHPTEDVLAVATTANLFLYAAARSQPQ
eukprot:gnl/Dysnectes_brevis/2527_a3036_1661.p1 GENE.gnl/Dysnectes_brevis/2527_a3036_1661~~gnl/Dysnectes_brevis/2527_a3036_1661.p1  ORF type:complete len:461 (+),score=101.21 gnl/Dysnectes_brevis/2527_a3036_1661:36-1418(+)